MNYQVSHKHVKEKEKEDFQVGPELVRVVEEPAVYLSVTAKGIKEAHGIQKDQSLIAY